MDFDLNLFGKIAGIAGVFIMIWILIATFRADFSVKKFPVCELGNRSGSANFYNFLLGSLGLTQVVFVLALLDHFGYLFNPWLVLPLVLAGVSTIVAGAFPSSIDSKIHRFAGVLPFVVLVPWSLGFHLMLLFQYPYLAAYPIIFSLFLGCGLLYLYFRYGCCAVPEILFFILVIFWNAYFTFLIW